MRHEIGIMRIERSSIQPVKRSEAPRGATRDNSGSNDARANTKGRELVPFGLVEARNDSQTPAQSSSRTLVTAQVIAQKLPSMSDRRLMRHFPETATAAYRQTVLQTNSTKALPTRRSA